MKATFQLMSHNTLLRRRLHDKLSDKLVCGKVHFNRGVWLQRIQVWVLLSPVIRAKDREDLQQFILWMLSFLEVKMWGVNTIMRGTVWILMLKKKWILIKLCLLFFLISLWGRIQASMCVTCITQGSFFKGLLGN